MSRELRCGSCGTKLLTYEGREREYGPMIRKCKKCGVWYLDPRYHELAVEGIPEDVFGIRQYLVAFVVGILIAWRGWYLFGVHQLGMPDQMQWLLPALFLALGVGICIAAIVEVVLIKTGIKRRKYQRMYEESCVRMRDRGYVLTLRKLGYPVPERFL